MSQLSANLLVFPVKSLIFSYAKKLGDGPWVGAYPTAEAYKICTATKRLKCPPNAWEGRGVGISEIEGYWFWCQKYFDLGPNVSQAQFAESLKLFQSSFLTVALLL